MNLVFLFFHDWAWTEAKLTEGYENNWLKSMGLGTTIGFNNGLLNLVYGLGSSVGDHPIKNRENTHRFY